MLSSPPSPTFEKSGDMTSEAATMAQLDSISDWSEALHLAFLSRPFVSRPLKGESRSEGVSTGELLIKIFPHTPSLTLGILVLPISSFSPLYEGLTLRTLQRRTKSQKALQSSQAGIGGEKQLFRDMVQQVDEALQGQDKSERWLTCEIGRGEASLKIHLRTADDDFSISFDLSALDREDGPRFVKDHLLYPLASMALKQETATPDALQQLLSSSTELMSTGERLAGITPIDLAPVKRQHRDVTSTNTNSSPLVKSSKPTPSSHSTAKRSPTLSKSRSPEEARQVDKGPLSPLRKAPSPGTPDSESKQKGKLRLPVAKGDDHDDEDNDEDEIVIYNPTPTPSSHHSRQSNVSRDSRLQSRLDSQSPTPTSLKAENGNGRQNGAKSMQSENAGAQQVLKAGPTSYQTAVAQGEEEEEEEEEISLSSRTLQRSTASPADTESADVTLKPGGGRFDLLPAPTPAFESMPATPAPLDPVKRETPSSLTPGGVGAQLPSLAHGDIVNAPTGGVTGGRGTSRYTRGLAKRKRI